MRFHLATLFPPPSTALKMQLFVKTLTGKTITPDCQPDAMVGELKGLVQEREGIPPDQQ